MDRTPDPHPAVREVKHGGAGEMRRRTGSANATEIGCGAAV